MTIGKPFTLLMSFSIPLFFGNVFQQFYSMVDSIVVGRFVSVEALAAVGAVNGFSFMVVGFASGLAQGFSVMISQRYGAKDIDGMRKVYAQSILCALGITLIISVLFFFLSMPLLRLINTPDNIIGMANDYISIIYLFLITAVFYNLFSSVLRAVGDSKSPVLFLLLSSALNIVLDLFFVLVIPLAVKGVAIATVIAQGVSALVAWWYINKKFPVFRCKKSDWQLDRVICKNLLRIGLPGAIQFSITAIGVIIVQAVLNGFGSDTIAAYSVGTKIESLITQFFLALGMAISTFAGQNLGAGKIDRIKSGFVTATIMSIVYSLLAMAVAYLFTRPLCYIFVDKNSVNPVVIDEAVQYTTMICNFFVALGFIYVFRTGAQGLGSGKIPMANAIIELSLRIICSFTLPRWFGYVGICLASPAAWVCAGFTLPFLTARLYKRIKENYNQDSSIKGTPEVVK